MAKKVPSIEGMVIGTFAFVHLGVIWALPRVWDVDVGFWVSALAYGGGMMLGLQFIGDRRLADLDRTLTRMAAKINETLNALLLTYFLIKKEPGERRTGVALWYLWSFVDLILVTWFLKIGAQRYLGVSGKEFVGQYSGDLYIAFGSLTGLMLVEATIHALWPNVITKWIGTVLLYIWVVPVAICFAWVTVPWLLLMPISWLVAKGLMVLVYVKKRLRLGNVFYVLGAIMLTISFVLFLIERK